MNELEYYGLGNGLEVATCIGACESPALTGNPAATEASFRRCRMIFVNIFRRQGLTPGFAEAEARTIDQRYCQVP